jgi:hypothetical protein
LHRCVKNEDLPAELLENKNFCKKIMPAIYQWAAALQDPWGITQDMLTGAVKVIVGMFLGDEYDPKDNSAEVRRVSLPNSHMLFKFTCSSVYLGFSKSSQPVEGQHAI